MHCAVDGCLVIVDGLHVVVAVIVVVEKVVRVVRRVRLFRVLISVECAVGVVVAHFVHVLIWCPLLIQGHSVGDAFVHIMGSGSRPVVIIERVSLFVVILHITVVRVAVRVVEGPVDCGLVEMNRLDIVLAVVVVVELAVTFVVHVVLQGVTRPLFLVVGHSLLVGGAGVSSVGRRHCPEVVIAVGIQLFVVILLIAVIRAAGRVVVGPVRCSLVELIMVILHVTVVRVAVRVVEGPVDCGLMEMNRLDIVLAVVVVVELAVAFVVRVVLQGVMRSLLIKVGLRRQQLGVRVGVLMQ